MIENQTEHPCYIEDCTRAEGSKVISLKIILFVANGVIDQNVTLLFVFDLFRINFAYK